MLYNNAWKSVFLTTIARSVTLDYTVPCDALVMFEMEDDDECTVFRSRDASRGRCPEAPA